MRILKSTDYSIESPVFVAADRETPADPSVVSCTVTREDGTSLGAIAVTSGTIDGNTSLGSFFGRLTAASGHTSQVDHLALTWTGTSGGNAQTYTQKVQVVGSHYVTVPEIRAYPGMEDTAKFSRALLEDIRDDLEDYIEHITGKAWARRYFHDYFDGQWDRSVGLSKQDIRTILSVRVNGIAQTPGTFDIVKDNRWSNQSVITWRSNWLPAPDVTNGRNNVSITYEYGADAPPGKLKRELLKAIKSEASATNTNTTFSQISQTVDGVVYRYNTPNPSMNRPTGEMTLDPVLDEYKDRWVMA